MCGYLYNKELRAIFVKVLMCMHNSCIQSAESLKHHSYLYIAQDIGGLHVVTCIVMPV